MLQLATKWIYSQEGYHKNQEREDLHTNFHIRVFSHLLFKLNE